MPIVKKGTTWYFDTKKGKEELINRRIKIIIGRSM
ncbi:MAG TPA: hypothetical protein DCP92_03920 [Nitrospiraceae bacterium]|nr:hypothetical protein [Nitrospiraceae bacterium]